MSLSPIVVLLPIIAASFAQPPEPLQFRFMLQFLDNTLSEIDAMQVPLGPSYDQLRTHFERLRLDFDEPIRDDAHADDRVGAGPIRAARYLDGIEGDPPECAICIEPIVTTAATSCPYFDQHCFHLDCAERSLRTTSCRNRCPICRGIWIYCH